MSANFRITPLFPKFSQSAKIIKIAVITDNWNGNNHAAVLDMQVWCLWISLSTNCAIIESQNTKSQNTKSQNTKLTYVLSEVERYLTGPGGAGVGSWSGSEDTGTSSSGEGMGVSSCWWRCSEGRRGVFLVTNCWGCSTVNIGLCSFLLGRLNFKETVWRDIMFMVFCIFCNGRALNKFIY